ncbi:MAG: hypothetical protein ABW212_03915 [Pseudonocardia sediminis]
MRWGRFVAAIAAAGVLAAAVVVARDAWALPATYVLGAVVATAAVAVLLTVYGVDACAAGLLVAAVGTTTWNAVALGGLKPAAGLLAVSLLLFAGLAVLDRRRVSVPPWVWVLGGAILLIVAVHLVWPTDISYLAARYVSGYSYSAAELAGSDLSGAATGVQWLVATVALPVTVCLAAARRPGLPLVLADAWVAGSAVSAAVALTDELGVTDISASLIAAVDVGGRQSGLSVQPNHLAVAAALTVPLALWRALRGGRPVLMWASVAVLAGGLFVAESRGGLVIAVVACLVVVLADRRARGALPIVAGLGLATLVVVVSSVPGLLTGLAEQLRLSGADSAAESDAIRERIGLQALYDFLHDPVRGVGLEVAVQGHNIYLQLLASGGVLLLAGFVIAQAGFLLDARTLRAVTGGLSAALALSTATWLVVGIVENHLTDLFLYVPFALVAGLRAAHAVTPIPTEIESAPR